MGSHCPSSGDYKGICYTGGSSSHSPTADLRGMLPALALRKAEETSDSLKKQALNLFAFCDEILKG